MPFVYMIKNKADKLYIGVSNALNSRLEEHNTKRGSVFTQSGNYRVVFQKEYSALSEARKREIQIKKWRRNKKEMLIRRFIQGLPTKAQ